MSILYEFECEACYNVFEVLTTMDNRHQPEPCPQCGYDSYMILSPVRCNLDGTSGDFPTAADRWARMHEQEARREPKEDWNSVDWSPSVNDNPEPKKGGR